MGRLAITITLLLLFGCEGDTTTNITEPAPLPGSATASATCQQNGSALSIACDDSSSDPQSIVTVDGVRFTARLSGSGFQVIELGSVGTLVILDVTGGGAGTYSVAQELYDDQGRVVGSENYSVTVG